MKIYLSIIGLTVLILSLHFSYWNTNTSVEEFLITHTNYNVGEMRTADDLDSNLGEPFPISLIWSRTLTDSGPEILEVKSTYTYIDLKNHEVVWNLSLDEKFERASKKYVDKDGYFNFPPNPPKTSISVYDVGGDILKNEFIQEFQLEELTIYEYFGQTSFDVSELYPEINVPVTEDYSARTFIESSTGIEIGFEEQFTDYAMIDGKKKILLDAKTTTTEFSEDFTKKLISEYKKEQYVVMLIFPAIILVSAFGFGIGYYLKNKLSKKIPNWTVFLPAISMILIIFFIFSPNETPVKITYSDFPGYYILLLAQEGGFFEKNGVDVELVPEIKYRDTVNQYLNNYVDGMMIVVADIIEFQRLGIHSNVVWISDESLENDGIVIKNNASIEKLRNTDCAINRSDNCKVKGGVVNYKSFSEFLVRDYIKSIGVPIQNVELVVISNQDVPKAIENDEVLIGHAWTPNLEESVALGHQIVYTPTQSNYEIIDGLIFHESFVQNNIYQVAQIVRSLNQAADFLHENPARAVKIIAENTELSEDELHEFYNTVDIFTSDQQIDALIKAKKSILVATELLQDDCKIQSYWCQINQSGFVDVINFEFGGLK